MLPTDYNKRYLTSLACLTKISTFVFVQNCILHSHQFTMRTPKRSDIFRKLNTQYRVVFIDDENLEEVGSFQLTMRKLYILLSSMFVLVAILTVCILLLTPLKYYIPGYGSGKTRSDVIKMKQQVDSLSDLVAAQQAYEANLRNVIGGKKQVTQDTSKLDLKKVKQDEMKTMVPMKEVKKEAIEQVKKDNKKKKDE